MRITLTPEEPITTPEEPIPSSAESKLEGSERLMATIEKDMRENYELVTGLLTIEAKLLGEVPIIGTGIMYSLSGENIYAREVFHGSPAELAGIKPGDKIDKVNGVRVSAANFNDISSMNRDSPEGRVDLTIRRGDEVIEFKALQVRVLRVEPTVVSSTELANE